MLNSITAHKKKIALGLLVIVFFALRIPGLSLPPHQDEAKTVEYSMSVQRAGELFAHPPFMQMIFVAGEALFGPDYFRMVPLIFGLLAAFVLFALIRRKYGFSPAFWSTILFTLCSYNVWGNLQLDVDGSILPFFFLLSAYCYDRFQDEGESHKYRWLVLLCVALLCGWLVKLNFIIAIAAFGLEHVRRNWRKVGVNRDTGLTIILGLVFGVSYVALLYIIQYLYPAFRISSMMGHANQFTGDTGGSPLQILVQGVKALYYLSPLLLAPLFFVTKDVLRKSSVFCVYLVLGFLFYFVLFDFSQGALDKYLMFLTLPLSVLAGLSFHSVLASVKREDGDFGKKHLLAGIVGLIVSGAIFALNFIPHAVVPLYPKTLWFSRVLQGDWSILTPFNGGSGPLGFYMLFAFIAVSFITAFAVALAGFFKKEWKPSAAIVIICIGVMYNAVLTEELVYGKFFGNSGQVLAQALNFIEKEDSIKQVLTFNNTGSYPLIEMKKYAGRIYANPDFESGYREKFRSFEGHYLVVEIPRLYGFYAKFFENCKIMFETRSQDIPARVYDCRDAVKLIDVL